MSRRYALTINNPLDKNITHERIKLALGQFKGLVYWALADEIGLETHTLHTHIFIMLRSPVRFSTIKRRFPDAHIEAARGSIIENRDYVAKTGKWANDPKADTSIEGTFEESGEPPDEPGQGARTDIAAVYEMIVDGMSNAEIMAANPDYAGQISRMDKIRQDILEAKYREIFRELSVTYIFGPTQTGKTRSVLDCHGYGNVFRVTDYNNNRPFDRYANETVMCFDEFRSSLPVGDMLNYLDGYPLSLPARYANRQACYVTVYIISNIDLSAQYPNVQQTEPETWRAFLRRIHHVIEYKQNGPPVDHGTAIDYIFPPEPPTPEWVKEAEQALQDEIPF